MSLRFQQNSSFSQLRLHYPEHLKFPDKSTPQNTFFTEQLPVAAFDHFYGTPPVAASTQYLNIFFKKRQAISNKFLLFYQSPSNHSGTISGQQKIKIWLIKKVFKPDFIFNICEEPVLTLHVDTQQPHPYVFIENYVQ